MAGKENMDNQNNNSAIIVISRIWRIIRIPLVVIAVLFVGLMIYRVPVVMNRIKTDEVVKKIHAQKLTMADVLGQNLPPEPDAFLKDATIEGIDANNNGIRDDVELAIFKLHPDSARVRAAELQYAMALQIKLTEVFNTETWKISSIEDSRGYACISETYPRNNLQEFIKVTDALVREINDLQYSTDKRIARKKNLSGFTTNLALPDKNFCHIDLGILPN